MLLCVYVCMYCRLEYMPAEWKCHLWSGLTAASPGLYSQRWQDCGAAEVRAGNHCVVRPSLQNGMPQFDCTIIVWGNIMFSQSYSYCVNIFFTMDREMVLQRFSYGWLSMDQALSLFFSYTITFEICRWQWANRVCCQMTESPPSENNGISYFRECFFEYEVLIDAAVLHFLFCSHWLIHYWKPSCPTCLSENALYHLLTPSCFTKLFATKPNTT